MYAPSPLLLLPLLVACQGLEPHHPTPEPATTVPGAGQGTGQDTQQTWDFDTPPGHDPVPEAWTVDLKHVDVLPAQTWYDIDRQLAVVILREDNPTIEVRTGSVFPDTIPPQQDYCSPVSARIAGELEEDGTFQVALHDEDVDVGQAWIFDTLWLIGTRDGAESTLSAVASIPAGPLAQAAWGALDDGCDRFETVYGYECTPCENPESHGDELCVKLELFGAVVDQPEGLDLEPVSKGDVDANPACE